MTDALYVGQLDNSVSYKKTVYQCKGWTLYHTPEWLKFLDDAVPGECLMLGIYRGRSLVGVMPGRSVRFGPVRLFGSPMPGWNTAYMGPIWLEDFDPKAFWSSFKTYLKENGFHHAEIVSIDSLLNSPEGWRTEIAHTYVAPLLKDADKMMGGFSKSCRKAIRRASKNGIVVEFTDDKAFINIYYDQLRQVFAKSAMEPTYSIERVMHLYKNLKPSGRLLTSWARINDRIIATRIDMLCNNCLRSFGSASDLEMLGYYPNELLRYFVMSWAGSSGFISYDMSGGGDYKAKFNAVLVEQTRFIKTNFLVMFSRNAVKKVFYWKKRFLNQVRQITGQKLS